MPRKPSAAVPRSETTAELIARITAERDAPVPPPRRAVGVLDAGERTRAIRVPAPRSPAPAIPRQRGAEPPRQRRVEPLRLRRIETRPFSDDVLADPQADDTPTVTFGVVAPVAPRRPAARRHALTHRLLPIALGAAAMIAISVYTANGFALPDFTDPGPRVGDTGNVLAPDAGAPARAVPEPGPAGPTVPAPAAGPAAGPTVPAPVPSGGAPDVRLTDASVPAPGY